MSIVSRLWRRAGVAIVLLAALTAAGCAALVAKERELTFRPERGVSGWFTGLPSDVQVFYLPVTGGPNPERVHAWFWPHPHPSAPTLLYLHGVRWNLTAHLRRIENLRSFGFTVLAIDYRGFGESDGEMPSEESVYEDAHAAWRWVVERERDPSKRFVYGHSLGTAVATHLASDEGPRDGMGGLILEGAFTNLPEMAAALAPSWLPIDKLVTQQFDTRSKIARVPAPVLIVHGTEDRMVPYRFSQSLYAAARDPKRLVLVEGGGHYNTSWVGSAAYRQALAELFRLPLANAGTDPGADPGASGHARVSARAAGARAPAVQPAYAAP